MPLPSVHFLLAGIPLRRWLRDAAHAPFNAGDPVARNAYFQGALGPDMGLFPGGEPILSELAHNFQPEQLTRTLRDSARTEVQRAFACGWVTHMLADNALHPLIDTDAARRVAANGADPSDPVLVAAEHVRIELGLDVMIHAQHAELRALRLRPCFDPLSIRYVADSYRATYGLSFQRKWLLRSHRVVAPLTAALGLLERVHTRAAAEQGTVGPARFTLRCLRRALRARASRHVAAFIQPVRPRRRLLAAFTALQLRFEDSTLFLAGWRM